MIYATKLAAAVRRTRTESDGDIGLSPRDVWYTLAHVIAMVYTRRRNNSVHEYGGDERGETSGYYGTRCYYTLWHTH